MASNSDFCPAPFGAQGIQAAATETVSLPSTPRRSPKRRSSRLSALLLLTLMAGLSVMGSGCQMLGLGSTVAVADNVDQAFKDAQAKEAAAKDAQAKNRKDDAAKIYKEADDQYSAISKKFTGENHITAIRDQARVQEEIVDLQTAEGDVHDYSQAMHTLRSARQESETQAPTLHADIASEYDALITRMDNENKKTKQYQFMNILVTYLGGDNERAPILAIFTIAVAVTLVTWPLRIKQAKSAREMARYQPEIKKLSEKYKGDPQVLWQKQQAFNKKHGINQFAGCIPALLQWPVVFVMYRLILNYQYHFQHTHFLWINPATADAVAHMGLPFQLIGHNLGEQDIILLALYAVSMFVQTKLSPVTTTDPQAIEQQKMMATFMPVIFFMMMLQYQLPSAFVLYWVSSNVLFVGQQWLINRRLPTLAPLVLDDEDDDLGEAAKPLKPNPKLVSPSKTTKRK